MGGRQPTTGDNDARQHLRRASISSARTSATLPPTPSSSSHRHSYTPNINSKQSFATPQKRERTTSTFSLSSKPAPYIPTSSGFSHHNASAALTSLSAIPSSRPSTPPLVSHFPPPARQPAGVDSLHPLLPDPYLATHLTLTRFYGPLQESWERVVAPRMRAGARAGKA